MGKYFQIVLQFTLLHGQQYFKNAYLFPHTLNITRCYCKKIKYFPIWLEARGHLGFVVFISHLFSLLTGKVNLFNKR